MHSFITLCHQCANNRPPNVEFGSIFPQWFGWGRHRPSKRATTARDRRLLCTPHATMAYQSEKAWLSGLQDPHPANWPSSKTGTMWFINLVIAINKWCSSGNQSLIWVLTRHQVINHGPGLSMHSNPYHQAFFVSYNCVVSCFNIKIWTPTAHDG